MRITRRSLIIASILLLVAVGLALFLSSHRGAERYQTATVDRGDIQDAVGATGTLQAVTTVQVGSQVSGIIQSLSADFNSQVRRGDVVARLDPSLFQARLEQARANLLAARANADRSRASVEDTRQKLARARELAAQNLLPATDLETAKTNFDAAAAQLKATEAAVSQAQASVNQAQVDLNHTVITAPIDGVVIARNFDIGQTVAASFQAPTLFVIANDLGQMQVNASIDEADIGRVREGQAVTFRVDAYPDRTFAGRLKQVRLQPTTLQNVVTYSTIVSADNPKGLLMPGMTATVSVVVAERDNVLRVPAAALRFRPEGASRARASATATRSQEASASRESTGSARGGDGSRRRDRSTSSPSRASGGSASAPRRKAQLYVPGKGGQAEPRDVVLGLSDGQYVEVLEGLQEGDTVITAALTANSSASRGGASATPSSPFNPSRPQPRQR